MSTEKGGGGLRPRKMKRTGSLKIPEEGQWARKDRGPEDPGNDKADKNADEEARGRSPKRQRGTMRRSPKRRM